ncbi:DNA-binding LytR/AlgR family response regulator [Mucilaginibacter rubeus]|uniref:LytR/AlgR family response regulator transcription factor n=1 Tax=Mucilaginibacter rubeus TaxID=2027860 RepID=UPI0033911FE7
MNAVIIDDEPPAIEILSAYIQRTNFLTLRSTYINPTDALAIFNSPAPPDVTFLDINMPGMDGLDFARLIGHKSQVILTTSFRNHGPEAFELSVRDYLLKPFSYERFLEAIKKVMPASAGNNRDPGFFFLHTETRGIYANIEIRNILFIESDDNLVHITMLSGRTTAMHQLSEVQSWLPATQFSRVHRSYLVNLAMVDQIDHGQVVMKNGTKIPIGRKYKEPFMASLRQITLSGRA